MLKVICDFCGEDITHRIIYPYEMKRNHRHFCNKKCRLDYEKAHDHFKNMSDLGKQAHHDALLKSNRDKPRRKRKSIKN